MSKLLTVFCETATALSAAKILIWNFQGCIAVHLSRFFVAVVLSGNSDIISQPQDHVNNFFKLFPAGKILHFAVDFYNITRSRQLSIILIEFLAQIYPHKQLHALMGIIYSYFIRKQGIVHPAAEPAQQGNYYYKTMLESHYP